ncbi:MAG: RRXRR domain-containing protein [Microcoleus sp.]
MHKNARIPVIGSDSSPRMPTKYYRAQQWVDNGKAEWVSNDLQIKAVRLLRDSGDNTQSIAIGIDPGKLYSGVGVVSKLFTLFRAHLNLPFKRVKARKEAQKLLRRARRGRRINRTVAFRLRAHRQCRFNNRRQKKVAPSIRANRQLELRIVSELCKLFPITSINYEYVKADVDQTSGRKKARSGKGFSAVMVGQKWMMEQLSKLASVKTQYGWETANLRRELGLVKSKDKAEQSPQSHAVDGVVLASSEFMKYQEFTEGRSSGHRWNGIVRLTVSAFRIFSRPGLYRRQLHFEKPEKGGVRKRKGGTVTPFGFRSGDYVEAVKSGVTYRGWIGGYTDTEKSQKLSVYSATWKRIGQFTLKNVTLIQRSNGLCTI